MWAPSIITTISLLDRAWSVGSALDDASISAATLWVRLRIVAWLTGEHGKRVDNSRPASRNECRAPSSAWILRSSGVQRSGSKSASDENDRSANPIVFEHGQMLIRGAATVTVPNSVWMVRVRQSRWRRILRHAGQTREQTVYSSIWVWSTTRCSSARRFCAQPFSRLPTRQAPVWP